MIIHNVEQNTPEWFKLKKGVISSSRVKNVLVDKLINKTEIITYLVKKNEESLSIEVEDKKEAKLKLSEYKKEISNLSQLDLEEQFNITDDIFHKAQKKEYFRLLAEMLGYEDDIEDPRERGHRLEPEAVKAFEEERGIVTSVVGFCTREDYPEIGLSPDRLIEKAKKYIAGVEVKSPGVVNHLETIILNKIPDEYWEQVIQYFVVNDDCELVYFISYNPIVKVMPLKIIVVKRSEVETHIKNSFRRQIQVINHLKEDVLSLSF